MYGTCKKCGCTDNNACHHPDHGSCWWIDDSHELCSHCGIKEIVEDKATQHPKLKTARMKASEFKPKKSEHDIQKVCVEWFRVKYPKYLIYAIPNGGKREKKVNDNGKVYSGEGNRLKAEGVLAGVPDLHIPVAKQGFHGLYIEMKAGTNKPSSDQLTIMDKLRNECHRCEVCWSLDEFMKVVENYFNNYSPEK